MKFVDIFQETITALSAKLKNISFCQQNIFIIMTYAVVFNLYIIIFSIIPGFPARDCLRSLDADLGDDSASFGFIKQKEKIAKELGVDFRLYKLPADITNDKARAEVRKIAESKSTGGVIVQLPVPEHLNRHYILNAVPREKDVDVLSERALGALYVGRNLVLPPAVGTLEVILQTTNYKLQASKVAVVGLGLLIGKPIANYLMGKTEELFLLHERSDLGILNDVDLVISGVGVAGLIKPEMLKSGADPALDITRVGEIRVVAGVPLVLHGGSGNSDQDFRAAIAAGVAIVHINTELRVAFRDATRLALQESPDEVAPYKYLKPSQKSLNLN